MNLKANTKIETIYDFLNELGYPYLFNNEEYKEKQFEVEYNGLKLIVTRSNNMDADDEQLMPNTFSYFIKVGGRVINNSATDVPKILDYLKSRLDNGGLTLFSLSKLKKNLQEFSNREFYEGTKYSDISISCDLAKGNCYDISEELYDFLKQKGYKDLSLVEVKKPKFDLTDAHYEWKPSVTEYSNLFHIILKVNNYFIDFTGIQYSKEDIGLKIYTEEQLKKRWGKISYFDRYAKGGLVAPNGKPTNLTPEQYRLVRTPAFKAWFGDWERLANATIKDPAIDVITLGNISKDVSKVVDENGEPLVVYHGSKSNRFNSFNIISETHRGVEVGSHFGTYIQSQKIIAQRKSKNLAFQLYEVFLCIKNIIRVDDINWWTPANINKFIFQKNKIKISSNNPSAKDVIEQLNKKKINGFIYSNLHEGEGHSYVVFNPNQIKLADGTNTTFDGSNADIRYSGGGGVGYVSYRDKYNKKYGYEKNESHSLKEISKDTGVSNKGLQKIYNKGIGAFKTNPSSVRPNVKSKEQWAKARVYSAVMGGKAARVDAKELKMNNGGEILLAPNGKPSNLTAEQYRIVRTPEFKAWFGDWENEPENASKVVDSNGEPLVIYRGMSKNVSNNYKFDFKTQLMTSYKRFNKFGFYFTDNLTTANEYANHFAYNQSFEEAHELNKTEGKWTHYDEIIEKSKDYEVVISYFLNLKNFLNLTPSNPKFPKYKEGQLINFASDYKYKDTTISLVELLDLLDLKQDYIDYVSVVRNINLNDDWANIKKDVFTYFTEFKGGKSYGLKSLAQYLKHKILQKYDGVVFFESMYSPSNIYVAFSSNQIKLADGTNTTFDGSNPDIRYSGGGVVDADIPTYLYHTTPSNNFQKIKQNGLSVAFDNRIYFTKNLSSSIDIANQLHKAYKENENVEFYHIWKIDTNKLTNPIFFKDEDYDNAVYITEPIPKNAIKYYESTKIKYADGGGYIGSCVDIGSSNKEVCEYFPNATIMAEYVGNPDENEWGKSKETTPKEFYKYVSKDDVPKKAINGEHTYHYIAQDGSNRDMNINETAIYFIYNIASDIHYFFKKTKYKTGGDLVNEPYISDNFQIGPNGAYEHTEENEIINQYADGVDLKKKLKKPKKPKGDCYYAAAQLVMGNRFKHLFGDNNITYIGTPYLVHAEVRGQGKVANIRFGHAWVEDDENIYDYSNGNEFVMPKEIYYAIGDIDNQNPLKYQKYTFEEARRKMVTTRHYGEWDLEVDC